jgi:hypothetical protein
MDEHNDMTGRVVIENGITKKVSRRADARARRCDD